MTSQRISLSRLLNLVVDFLLLVSMYGHDVEELTGNGVRIGGRDEDCAEKGFYHEVLPVL